MWELKYKELVTWHSAFGNKENGIRACLGVVENAHRNAWAAERLFNFQHLEQMDEIAGLLNLPKARILSFK